MINIEALTFKKAYRSANLKHLKDLERSTLEFSVNFFNRLVESITPMNRFKNVNGKSLSKIITVFE